MHQPGRSSQRRQVDVSGGFGSVKWLEPILHWARKQEFYQTVIPFSRGSLEQVFTAIETFDLEFLSRLDVVLSTNLGWYNYLALGGDGRSHEGKIPSYL